MEDVKETFEASLKCNCDSKELLEETGHTQNCRIHKAILANT